MVEQAGENKDYGFTCFFLCSHTSLYSGFHPVGDLSHLFLNRIIININPRDIAKEIRRRLQISALITGICSVNMRLCVMGEQKDISMRCLK